MATLKRGAWRLGYFAASHDMNAPTRPTRWSSVSYEMMRRLNGAQTRWIISLMRRSRRAALFPDVLMNISLSLKDVVQLHVAKTIPSFCSSAMTHSHSKKEGRPMGAASFLGVLAEFFMQHAHAAWHRRPSRR